MDLDYWVQLVVSVAPAIISVIGVISAIAVGVKKVKQVTDEPAKTIKDLEKESIKTREEMGAVLRENAQLKRDIDKLIKKVSNIHVSDKE